METVNIYEAKNQLSKLIALAEAGEDVIIARNGTPAVRLVPVAKLPPRQLGHFKGLFTVPDDFDDEDPEIEATFNG